MSCCKPVFRTPSFPLTCGIWRNGHLHSNAPDVLSECSLTPGLLGSTAISLGVSQGQGDFGAMWLLLPPCTDIRDRAAPGGRDSCEVPIGSGRFYDVAWVDDIGLGYPNEHRFASVIKTVDWPVPFPCAGGAPIPPPPPPPQPLLGIAQGSSLGALVPNFMQPLPVPGTGWVMVASTYIGASGPSILTCPGLVFNSTSGAVFLLGSPQIGAIEISYWKCTAGTYNFLISLGGMVNAAFQVQAYYFPTIIQTAGMSVVNQGAAGLPFIPSFGLAEPAPGCQHGAYACQGAGAAPGYAPPNTAQFPAIQDSVLGTLCTLQGAGCKYYVPGGHSFPTTGAGPGYWSMLARVLQ